MTKIEQILVEKDIQSFDFKVPKDIRDVIDAMKKYAEWYALKHQENILNNVQFIYGDVDIEGTSHSAIVDLDYDSIPNLPNHE